MLFLLRLNLIVIVDALLSLKRSITPHRLELIKKQSQPGDVTTFYFKPNKTVTYSAGQYGIWFLPKFVKGKPVRLFTVASPSGGEYLELTTRISQSDFKRKLADLPIGKEVTMFGPIGRFTLPKKSDPNVVLIAGGIGITPFHAFLESTDIKDKATLIHVASNNEYVYKVELEKLVGRSYFISRDQIDQTLSTVKTSLSPEAIYYISGPPKFVKSVQTTLKKLGVKNIKLDGFIGY